MYIQLDALFIYIYIYIYIYSKGLIHIYSCLRASPAVSNTLNLDAKLKKKSSSNGVVMGAKLLLMNSDQLYLGKSCCQLFISKMVEKPLLPS